MKLKKILTYLFIALSLFSCLGKKSSINITKPSSSSGGAVTPAASVSNVMINATDENQLKITGVNLDSVSAVRVTGPSGFDHTFQIESQTSTEIVVSALSAGLKIFADGLYNLIITDAHGAATIPITFTHSQLGANVGEVLQWDGSAWTPTPLSGLNLAGSWNASTNQTVEAGPQTLANGGVNTSPSAGDYYIVTVADGAGGTNIDGEDLWAIGDWIIFNGTAWDRIDNSSAVTSFNSRTGGITPASNDYSFDMIFNGAGLYMDYRPNNVSCADGEVLKYDDTLDRWICGSDNGGAGTVDNISNVSVQSDSDNNGTGDILFRTGTTTQVTIQNDGDIATNGSSPTTFGNDRHQTADTAGSNFTLTAGAATSGATDKDGGNLVLTSGISTGTGSSSIEFKTATASGTGVADNTPTTQMIINGSGDLGIGTTSPETRIHSFHPTFNSVATFESGDLGANIRFRDSTTTNIPLIGTDGNTIDFGQR